MRRYRVARVGALLAAFGAALGGALLAQSAADAPPPGFRPPSPEAEVFLASLETSRLVVFPTVVRGVDRYTYSVPAQHLAVDLLARMELTTVAAMDRRVDLGPPPLTSQWDMFQGGLEELARALEDWPPGADYVLAMDVLLPPGEREVFGIHTYILDREGRNAFSFLLNSHHEVFSEADLSVDEPTEAALEKTVLEATRVGIAALGAQIEHTRACTAWMAAHPARPMTSGVFESFEAGLPASRDAEGNPIGFSTFSDGPSTLRMATARDHPLRSDEAPDNTVLRMDFDVGVGGWAGLVYLVEGTEPRSWGSQDWSGFEGLSFWIYGQGSGTSLFVDVLDNRNPCSRVDDAERWTYGFVDDTSGWKQIVIPFADMERKEIWNDAPNDGLGLARIHGWAFGATVTDGPKTWYMDDVALWRGGTR